jgi:hypothetical protein
MARLALWCFLVITAVCSTARAQIIAEPVAATPTDDGASVVSEQHPSRAAVARKVQPDAPSTSPPAPTGKLRWNGLPIALSDGLAYASFGVVVGTESPPIGFAPGLVVFALGGPTIHAVNGEWGAAGLSLGARVVLPLVADGILVGGCDQGDCGEEAATGIAIGMLAATVLDLTVLSWERKPVHEALVQPSMSLGKDHAWLGASGRF